MLKYVNQVLSNHHELGSFERACLSVSRMLPMELVEICVERA